jgi:hypothetical protein
MNTVLWSANFFKSSIKEILQNYDPILQHELHYHVLGLLMLPKHFLHHNVINRQAERSHIFTAYYQQDVNYNQSFHQPPIKNVNLSLKRYARLPLTYLVAMNHSVRIKMAENINSWWTFC